jgi:hypothetical protein
LIAFNQDFDVIKDFYRLSTGLIQPKYLNNWEDEVGDEKMNSSRFEKMR